MPVDLRALCPWLVCCTLLAAAPVVAAEGTTLRTEAEQSGFHRTGRYAEVERLCATFAEHYPDAVSCESFGVTPEGRTMRLLVVSRTGALSAEKARERRLPVLLLQGGIHAGEIDGKDASFLALRQLLDGEVAPKALEQIVVLFVPVFNIDGHERFGAWNRPNQRGPEEMGWRTTGQNLNLNRDYIKAEAPEMRQMLALIDRWDPIAFADLHATDGAQFEHDISIMVEPVHSGSYAMRDAGRALRNAVIQQLTEQGSLPIPFYPSFITYDDPSSGIQDGVAPPRFSQTYMALRNRFGMLVETHSWRTYPERVKSTRNTIIALVEQTAREGRSWRRLADAADRDSRDLAGESVPVTYTTSQNSRQIEFRGYAYTRTPSEISGVLMTRYDETTPQIWTIPIFDEVIPGLKAELPGHAYVIPAAHADWMADKLRLHGVQFEQMPESLSAVSVQQFEATEVKFAEASFEGRQRLSVTGQWSATTTTIAAGSLLVPVGGNNGHLLAALLDPQAPDAFLAWGFFNNAFEGKEYMEPYVAEAVAREMLAKDPAVAQAFNERLASDPAFASNPQARLEFFYRRHSAWDERRNVYPVLRLDHAP
ncbi:MAG: M14 family metallopeptidase [Xanthomonadales bacterium]|nr:M14 family metallopeptidase [Xanthomonadales bacterium]